MINTLIEHLPIKLRKTPVVASASVLTTTADVEDADELDGSEEEDSETDLLDEEEDEATLLISSDEEAELEAQRIHFHELLTENLLSSTSSDGKKVGNSLNTAALRNERQKQDKLTEKSKSKQQPPQPKSQKQKQQTTQHQQQQQSELQIQHQNAYTQKHEKRSHQKQEQIQLQKIQESQETEKQLKLIQTKQKERKAQQEKQKADKESNKETELVINANSDEPNNKRAVAVSNTRRRCQLRTGSNYSDSSQGLPVLENSNETENCGIIYLHREQQKLTFNCSLCNLHCNEVHELSKHFYEMHKLFDEELIMSATPQRKSARQLAKSTMNELDVKTELTIANENLALSIPMQQTNGCRSLESCGCICVVKRREIMFMCGLCECKFTNVALMEKHLQLQHEIVASMKPSSETGSTLLQPKSELKTEVYIITELPVDDSNETCQPECNDATMASAIVSELITDQPEETVTASIDLLVGLPAPTPETPPPEEEELEKRNLKQLHDKDRAKELNSNNEQENTKQQENLVIETQPSLQEQKLNKHENKSKVSESNTKRQRTKDKPSGSKRTYKRKVNTDLINVTVEKKRKRNRIAAEKVIGEEVEISNIDERARRRSATQKSYKDFFVDQQMPVFPDSDVYNRFSLSSSPQITINCDLSRSTSSAEKSPRTSTIEGGSVSFDSSQLRFPCNQCSKSFHKASRLAEHKRLHTGEKPFGCDECGKRFRIKMRLTEHKLRHRKVKAYKCEKCGMGVATRQDLTQHQRHHNDDRRYQCSQCPKAFVRSSDLKIHVRVHTGEKPYVCEICQKSFRANQNLIVHRRSHSTEKNYKCDYCDKRFRRNIDRKVHHRTHTGEKPYKCEICQRAYSSRAHVRGHIEREHIPDAGGAIPVRKRPGPKPRRGKEDLTKQKTLIDELQGQEQRQQQEQSEQMKINQKKHERNETKSMKAAEKNLEVNTSLNSSPIPFTLRENIEQSLSSPVQRAVDMSVGGGVGVGVGVGGVQQVSVTVSMQVESVANSHLLPAEKENNKSLLVKSKGNGTVSKEHKITSYFAVLGRKAEI